MAFTLGQFLGGLLAMAAFAFILEGLIFRRVFDDPLKGKMTSVVVAWLAAGTLAGFGMANGGPFVTYAYLIYLLPALIVGAWFYKLGVDLREKIAIEKAMEAAEPFE